MFMMQASIYSNSSNVLYVPFYVKIPYGTDAGFLLNNLWGLGTE